jgi:hypothetical protein
MTIGAPKRIVIAVTASAPVTKTEARTKKLKF